MVKILYVSQYYSPEFLAGALRAQDHSKYWNEWGNDVTVYTGLPNHPLGRIFDGYEVKLLQEDDVNGVRVIRNKISPSSNKTLMSRSIAGVSYMLYGFINDVVHGREVGKGQDVVYASSGPVFAGLLGYKLARSRNCPLIIEFRDLTYIQLMASGAKYDSSKVKLIRGIELFLCNKAEMIVVVAKGEKDFLVKEGIEPSKISIIPNGSDCVDCVKINSEVLRFGYFGAMGLIHDVEKTVDYLARFFSKGYALTYILIGEGACRQDVELRASKEDCSFITIKDGMSNDELESYYSQIDMAVVSTAENEMYSMALPVKMFYALARGIPVLYIGPPGEAPDLINKAGAGITLCSSNEENYEKLTAFLSDKNRSTRLNQMSNNAKKVMKEKYSREIAAKRILELMEDVIQKDKKA